MDKFGVPYTAAQRKLDEMAEPLHREGRKSLSEACERAQESLDRLREKMERRNVYRQRMNIAREMFRIVFGFYPEEQ